MKSSLIILSGAGVSSLVGGLAVRGGCDLHLTVNGAISGNVGQIGSGQVRAGGGIAEATFQLRGNELWASSGRGCWWTPPTHTLQCDNNQAPAQGWSVACDGTVSFSGQKTFYECDSSDGQYNFYLGNGQGLNCRAVGFKTNDCHGPCYRPPPPYYPPPHHPPPPPPPFHCPSSLSGTFEFPHLIIPVDKTQRGTAKGTSYNGVVSPATNSLFNFDIPYSDRGKKCTLVFLFPDRDQLQTSNYVFSGDGKIDFSLLGEPANLGTTWNNQPGKKTDYGVTTVSPGHSYAITTFSCPAGEKIGFSMSEAGSTNFEYFQDYNPSPIGLYITVC